MFDFNSQPDNVQKLIDYAAMLHWNGRAQKARLRRMQREHKRATSEMVDVASAAGSFDAKGKGIECALMDLLGINKRDMWREIDRRAIEMYGAYPTA